MIDGNFARDALAFLRGRSVEESSVHILTVEHERRMSPNGFVVVLIVLVEYLACIPVTHDQLLENDWFHH